MFENIRIDKIKNSIYEIKENVLLKFYYKDVYIFFNLVKDVMWKVKYEMSCINGKLNYILVYNKILYVYLYCIFILY